MALIQCDFSSEVLGMAMSMDVILPQNTTRQIGMQGKAGEGKFPTLYLLHGCSDDHTIWLRRTSIERYVAPLGLAVVMPNVHRSYYTNMKEGANYWDYVSEEIPRLARSFFPLSDKREENFVAGLSMGGYGAFKMALKCPEKFCAAASLSGALEMDWMTSARPEEARRIFGDLKSLAGSEYDALTMLEQLQASGKPIPKLFQACGTEDFLYDANLRFKTAVETKGLDYTYLEKPGTHCWEFWDDTIQDVLKWLPL
jgi:S-formylglutathione hydrolase FrmB